MAALTKPRNTKQLAPPPAVIPAYAVFPIADNVKIFPGSLVMLDGGYLKPAAAAAGKKVVGRASSGGPGFSGVTVFDNTVTGHAAGALNVPVDIGCFKWANKAGDTFAQADVGGTAWVENDQTVRKTAAGSSCAGTIFGVESDGVWVLTFPGASPAAEHQADSAAGTVGALVTEFNALLAKLQAAGLMA